MQRKTRKTHISLIALGVLLAIGLALYLVYTLFFAIHQGMAGLPSHSFNPKTEDPVVERAEKFLEDLETPKDPTSLLKARNLFKEGGGPIITKEPRLYLESVTQDNLPVVYQGLMKDPDGRLIAQVNFKGVSHFVKETDKIENWEIYLITKEELLLKDPLGEEKWFPYRQGVEAQEAEAEIIRRPGGKRYKVKKGSDVEDFRVVGIEKDLVILQRGGEQSLLRINSEGLKIQKENPEQEEV